VDRGPSEIEHRVLQAIHDLSAGMPTVDVTQEAAARKAGLDPDSGEVSEAMAALVDRGYVSDRRGTGAMARTEGGPGGAGPAEQSSQSKGMSAVGLSSRNPRGISRRGCAG
jgi:hypothetical protein